MIQDWWCGSSGKLLEDGNPNPGLKRNLVTNVNTLEAGWASRAIGSTTEKAGEGIANGLRGLNRAHSDVQQPESRADVLDGVGDNQDLEADVDLEQLDDLEQTSSDLGLGSLLPLRLRK